MTKQRQKPCLCKAYPFPHRPLGGKCFQWQEAAVALSDRYAEHMRWESNDDIYNDPRHGQAADLNKGYFR